MVLRTNIFTNSLKPKPKANPLTKFSTPAKVGKAPVVKPVVNKALLDFSKQTISAPKPKTKEQEKKQRAFEFKEDLKSFATSPITRFKQATTKQPLEQAFPLNDAVTKRTFTPIMGALASPLRGIVGGLEQSGVPLSTFTDTLLAETFKPGSVTGSKTDSRFSSLLKASKLAAEEFKSKRNAGIKPSGFKRGAIREIESGFRGDENSVIQSDFLRIASDILGPSTLVGTGIKAGKRAKFIGEQIAKKTIDDIANPKLGIIPPGFGGQPMQSMGREGIEVPATPPKKLDPIIEEAKKYKTADEFVDATPVKTQELEGAMSHRPSRSAPATNIEEAAPDFYSTPRYYDFGGKEYKESIAALQKIRNKPDAEITIYRASPVNELRTGDWITLSKEKARLESLYESVPIQSFKVKAKDLEFAGDDITEFGYWGHSTKEKERLSKLWEESFSKEDLNPNLFESSKEFINAKYKQGYFDAIEGSRAKYNEEMKLKQIWEESNQTKQITQPTPKTKSLDTIAGERNVAFLKGGDEFNLPQTKQELPQIEPTKQAEANQFLPQDTPLTPVKESTGKALPKVLDDNTYVRNRAVKAKSQGTINKTINSAKEILRSAGKGAGKILAPISTRLENINPILKSALRKYEFNLGVKGKAYKSKVEPFVKKVSKFSKDDYADLDLALKNGDQAKIDELAKKYNMTEELEKVRSVLDNLYKQAREVGYDLGYQKNYFPRTIKDVDGFLDYFAKGDDWSIIQQAIKNKEASLQRYLTAEEKANLINTLVRGYGTGNITLSPTGAMKGRVIDVVGDELNQFYDDSISALGKYLDSTNEAIEARKFFGKSVDGTNIEDSIGAYTLKLIEEGKIKPSQEKELRDILQARFNQTGARGLTKLYKDLSYIDTMGSTVSAITQLGDIGTSLYKNGFYNTLKGLGKAVTEKQNITLKDIGIEKIAQEFEDPSLLSKALDNIFTLTGMNKIDTVMKETFINGALERLKKEALNNSPALQVKLTNTFGDEADEVMQALKKGEVNENVKLLAFNELLDIQPVSLSEMPEQYLKGGNGRIFYMLKTYTVKQFDIYRREIFREMKTNPAQGIKNLVKLTGALVVANATADEVKDFILGRETDFRDRTVDNLLRLLGISKFTVYKAREEGVGSAVAKTILPPFKLVDSIYKDILSGDSLLQGETVRSIPLIGNFYYWWFGKGVEKTEKRKLEYLREQREREIKPIYDSIQELKETNYEQARDMYNNLDERQKALYKKYRTTQKQKQTEEGKEAIKPIYNEIQKVKQTSYDKAKEMYLELSDDEKRYYKLLKEADEREKKLSEGDLATYKDGDTDTESNLIDTVKTYAKAIGVDPITAFNRIFTGERIRYVAGDVIVIERLPVEESQAIKEERGGLVDELKLDHTIPLQLGGSNSKKNLKLVPTDVWKFYSPVENALGEAVRNGKLKKKEAQQLITDFKTGLLTKDQVLLSIKK